MAALLALDPTTFGRSNPALPVAIAGEDGRRGSIRAGILLASRFLQARLLSIWGLVTAAMLCPPEAFAAFALYGALANVGALAAMLRFEAFFYQSDDRRRLGQVFRLSLTAAVVTMTCALVVVIVASSAGAILRGFGALFLISVGARCVIRLLQSEATAEGDFATVGAGNVVQAVVQPAFMIAMIGTLGANTLALLAADAFGHLVAALYLAWRRRGALTALVSPHLWSARELLLSARRWNAAPRLLLPSAVMAFAFTVAPLIALPFAADAELAAQVALAMRLLEMPTQLLCSVSVPLVMNGIRRTRREGRQSAVRLYSLLLIAAVAVVYSGAALVSSAADAWLAGSHWQGVGGVIGVLALFYAGNALMSPLSEIGALADDPRDQTALNMISLLGAGFAVLASGGLSIGLLAAIGLISLVRALLQMRLAWTRLGAAS